MEQKLYWAAFIFYSLAVILNVTYLAFRRQNLHRSGVIAMAAGFAVHTVAIIVRTVTTGNPPLTNMFEYLLILSWFSSIAFFISLKVVQVRFLQALCAPLIFMLFVAASMFPKEPVEQLMPALQSVWLPIHITLAAAGEAAFLVSFVAAILMLIRLSNPKRADDNQIPDMEKLESVIYQGIVIGYPLFTIGALFAGSVWAYRAWGAFWSWDPKETCSLIVWLIYSFYLHARLNRKWKGRKTAWLAIAGFISAILTMFSSMILGGLHSYGS
ncbi:MAG: c-type cytochrome biogenesis protein CcsB [Fibrobacteres bacterium]|nr:c-type cytochrome biogenesis protein CcsB [Fibrobacterota bacterium]